MKKTVAVIEVDGREMMTLTEASLRWEISRTTIIKMIHAGVIKGAEKSRVNGQISWIMPADTEYAGADWYKTVVANQEYQNARSSKLKPGDTPETFIARNEQVLSIEEIAKELGITRKAVRDIYERIFIRRRDSDEQIAV